MPMGALGCVSDARIEAITRVKAFVVILQRRFRMVQVTYIMFGRIFGAPLVEVLPLVPLFAGHTIGIAVVTYAGQMVFGLNADRMAAPDLEVLAGGIERSFAELRPHETKRPRRRSPLAAES